jgi:hypothetical protein
MKKVPNGHHLLGVMTVSSGCAMEPTHVLLRAHLLATSVRLRWGGCKALAVFQSSPCGGQGAVRGLQT